MRAAEVAVTGLGLVTPAGSNAQEFWLGLCSGAPTASADPALAGLPVDHVCPARDFEAERELGGRLSRRLDSFTRLALAAADRALADAKLDPSGWRPERVGVVVGVGGNSLETYQEEFDRLGRGQPRRVSPYALPRSVPNMAAGEIAIRVGAQGPNFVTGSACASGTTAIGVARDLVRGGTCDVVLAGGSESGRVPMAVACFARMGVLSGARGGQSACRPFAEERDGFVLGEGAAVLVLESEAHARARNAPVRARLRGYGASADAHHTTAPHPEGRGAERAIRNALEDAGLGPWDIDHLNAHGTATALGDEVEAAVLRRVFGDPPPVTATKGVTGHCLGASGAIEAAATVLALGEQTVPPVGGTAACDPALGLDLVVGRPRTVPMSAALTTSFAFGGQNAALVLVAA
ncbi:beta-ketoacyl-[acyl-carrier-protein] synthase family protein [Streptomyces sp. SBT349]|uniref:beta-ketoacyl-[acyl-carrier-protein] synthase family protein n=1 Tax=Streptomyces sp. SBT349 TaxID=1580539 RepID=UPI00066A919C|nr:beta-ketoacyl-[acyl-carrier-protein] synthase family protein [Streptomyces sp. SBT349]